MKRVFAFLGFSVAITLLLLNVIPFNFSKYILIIVSILLVLALMIKKLRQGRAVPLVIGGAVFACLIFIMTFQSSVLPQKSLGGESADISFKIVDIEEKAENGYIYVIKTNSVDLPNAPQNFKLKLKTKESIDADYYDNVKARVTFYSLSDDGFSSYGEYGNNVFIRAYMQDNNYTVSDGSRSLNYYIIRLRLHIREVIFENMDSSVAGLALSIFTGDKSSLDEDIYQSFKVCGLAHFTAVSGLHITIVCMGLYYFLKLLNVNNKLATALTLLVLAAYMGVADFSKSVIRAGIMITAILISQLFNHKSDTLNSLGLAVFVICLNPFSVTDVSAVLTVSSVIGLSVIKPWYDKVLRPKNKYLEYIYNGVAIPFFVLLSTLPAMWLFFGNISLLSLFLNLFCIPFLDIALICVFLLCILSFSAPLSFLPNAVATFCLRLVINITSYFSKNFEFLYLNINSNLVGVAIAGVLLFVGISLLISGKLDIKIFSAFISVVLIATVTLSAFDYNNNIYFSVSSENAIVVRDKDLVLVIDAKSSNDEYFIKEKLNNKKCDVLYSYYSSGNIDLSDYSDSIIELDDIKAQENLCEHISVCVDNDCLIVKLNNKVFKIYDDCVTMDGRKYYRNVYSRFKSKDTVDIIVNHYGVKEG